MSTETDDRRWRVRRARSGVSELLDTDAMHRALGDTTRPVFDVVEVRPPCTCQSATGEESS